MTDNERSAEIVARLKERADEKERVATIANRYWRAYQARRYVQEHLIEDRSDYAQTCADVRLARDAATLIADLTQENARLEAEIRGHVSAAELADKHGITSFRNALAAASPCCAEKRRLMAQVDAVRELCREETTGRVAYASTAERISRRTFASRVLALLASDVPCKNREGER